MKKITLSILALSLCLISGCSKTYKTVDEYDDAMKEIRNNSSYTIDAKGTAGPLTMDFKSYKKAEKWKTESIADSTDEKLKKELSQMQSVMQYDGKDLIEYNKNDKIGVSVTSELNKIKDENQRKFMIESQNPLATVYNWKFMLTYGNAKPEFGRMTTKNGFKCRMIKSGNKEVCVSDEYGIAVHQAITVENPQTKEKMVITTDVNKIDTNGFDDLIFKLPDGMKMLSISEVQKMRNKILAQKTSTKPVAKPKAKK